MWRDSGVGSDTYGIIINATTPENTNYSVMVSSNNTVDFTQLGTYTGNNTSH